MDAFSPPEMHQGTLAAQSDKEQSETLCFLLLFSRTKHVPPGRASDACYPPTLPSLNPLTRSQACCLFTSGADGETGPGREVACLQGRSLPGGIPGQGLGQVGGCGQEHNSHIRTSTVTPRSPRPGTGQELLALCSRTWTLALAPSHPGPVERAS